MLCIICSFEFDRPKRSKRVTCGRACACKQAWRNSPEKRIESIIKARRTPESRARSTAINNKRWAKPGAREELSEQNRQRWKDPEYRQRLSASIRGRWDDERRTAYSAFRTRQWAEDAEYRSKTVAAVRKALSSPAYRQKFSTALKARWRDPVMRAKYLAGRKVTPELRQRASDRMKRRWDDPDWRAKITAVLLRCANKRKQRSELQKIGVPPPVAREIVQPKRGFSMLAMRLPDLMIEERMRQALKSHYGRV